MSSKYDDQSGPYVDVEMADDSLERSGDAFCELPNASKASRYSRLTLLSMIPLVFRNRIVRKLVDWISDSCSLLSHALELLHNLLSSIPLASIVFKYCIEQIR
jgi:hypothetical protein